MLMVFLSLPFRSQFLYRLHVIQYPISNNFIRVKLDNGNEVTKMELCQKILLKISFHELHMDILKKYSSGFSMTYDWKGLVHISDSDLRLSIPSQIIKTTHHHQNICGCEMFIQDRTYQESFNHWHKWRLPF